jgi:outer membrane protein OmpA-like peptidoglycan-associated protein
MAMREFQAIGGPLLLGVLLVAGVGLSGCCTSPPLPRDSLVIQQPPEELKPFQYPQLPPPRAERPQVAAEPEPPPPPPPPPAPLVPAAVAAAIEDLGQKYPGLFTFDRQRGLFRFNSDITFDSGSSVVKPEAGAALAKLAQILNVDQARDRRLTIVGHTDSDRVRKPDTIARLKGLGKTADNMGLSEARAEAVAAVLKAGGTDAARIVTQGQGETQPIADNRSPDGKAKNRRVEIYLTPGGASAGAGGAPPAAGMAFPSGR